MNQKQYFTSLMLLNNLNRYKIMAIFGGVMGDHLASKFEHVHEGNVMRWLSYLDLSNQHILLLWLKRETRRIEEAA